MTKEEKAKLLDEVATWVIFHTETIHFSDGTERRCLMRSLDDTVRALKSL
jgi:hypothetical protein